MDRILLDRRQLTWLFFGFKGRVSRAAYFLAGLLLAIVQAFLLYRFTLVPQDSTAGQTWAVLFWAAVFVSIWSNIALGVKRLHDMSRPGIIAIALFIPILSIVAFIGLCLFPGDKGANRYGSRTNSPE